MNQQQLEIEVQFGDETPQDVFSALKEANARDVKELKQKGMIGVDMVILGVILANALTGLVAKLLRLWKCGVVVDARGSKVVVEKNCDLPRGGVVVVKPDGTEVTLNEVTETQLQDLIGKFGSANS
jgi:hypothetical protein